MREELEPSLPVPKLRRVRDSVFDALVKRGLILIICVGFVPISWFRGRLISGGDFFFPVSAEIGLENASFAWWGHGLGGLPNQINTFPFQLTMLFLERMGVSALEREQLALSALVMGAGLSMYYLSSILQAHRDQFQSVTSGIMYMTSFWSLVGLWTVPYTLNFYNVFGFAFLPFTLGLYFKAVHDESYRFATFAAASSLLMTGMGFTAWSYLGFMVLFTVILAVFDRRVSYFKILGLFLLLWCAFNAFWILQVLSISRTLLYSPYRFYSPDIDAYRAHTSQTIDTLRFAGYWLLSTKVYGDPITPWVSPWVLYLAFILPLLAFLSAVLKPRNKNVVLFLFVIVVSALILNGPNPPLGAAVVTILQITHLLPFVRDPFVTIGYFLNLSYCFLGSVTLSELLRLRLTNTSARTFVPGPPALHVSILARGGSKLPRAVIVGLLLFLVVGVGVWPYWTGAVIRSNGPSIPSARIVLPAYYEDAATWVNSMPDSFTILAIPLYLPGRLIAYSWANGTDGYFGESPLLWLFTKPVIEYTPDANGLAQNVEDLIFSGDSEVSSGLSAMNIKYLLFSSDFHPLLTPTYAYVPPIQGDSAPNLFSDPAAFLSFLSSIPNLVLAKEFGKLYFFRNLLWKPIPVKVAGETTVAVGDPNDIIRFLETDSIPNIVITPSSNESLQQFFFNLDGNHPIVFLRKDFNVETKEVSFYFAVPHTQAYVLRLTWHLGRVPTSWLQLDGRSVNANLSLSTSTSSIGPITLLSGSHTLSYRVDEYHETISDGWATPLGWENITHFAARNYEGWKPVIYASSLCDDPSLLGPAYSMALCFPPNAMPYKLPLAALYNDVWPVANSTLIFAKAGSAPIIVDGIFVDNKTVSVRTVWTDTDTYYRGYNRTVAYPIVIRPGNRAILQLATSTATSKDLYIVSGSNAADHLELYPVLNSTQSAPTTERIEEVNPTLYHLQIASNSNFYVQLTQTFNEGWEAYANGVLLTPQKHFIGSGFSNVWQIQTTGKVKVDLVFESQTVVYVGAWITSITLLISLLILAIYDRKNHTIGKCRRQ